MNQGQDADESGPSAKRMKSNDEENNPAERAVVAVNDEQQLADIFKLNIDCFEELFDYLVLNDLAAMGQTCKRMQRIAGHCFQLNYGAEHARFYKDGFHVGRFNIDCFSNSIQNASLNYYEWDYIDEKDELVDTGVENATNDQTMNFLAALKRLTSIKGIKMSDVHLTMARFNEMEAILCKVESVTFDFCDFDENVFDAFVVACSNVKYLSLNDKSKEQHWMHRIYPALEHISMKWFEREEIPSLKTFFELNTTIKQISLDVVLFWSNREFFKNSNIKLDILAIDYNDDDDDVEFYLFCRLLNKLHESGFYKKLHFYGRYWMNQAVIDQLASVKCLVRFCDEMNKRGINVGALSNVEELRVYESHFITDLKSLPHILLKLKGILLRQASSDDILPYVCHAQKLNKIQVSRLGSGLHFDENDKILDLIALNKEREKLVGAHKITIFVREDVYLATKWAMKQTDFKLIEMKREASYNWNFYI